LYANAGEKLQIQRQTLLVQYWQQTNLLLSMHNYTPLLISGNNKNEKYAINIIKPTQTGINRNKTLFEIIGAS
jgi:hypothetical protein